jgi:hypothetical protein
MLEPSMRLLAKAKPGPEKRKASPEIRTGSLEEDVSKGF